MGYCINCGDKVENEEKICVNCGTNMSKYFKSSDFEYDVERGSIGIIFDNLAMVIKGILISPVTSVIKFSKEMRLKSSIILTVILSALFGGFGTLVYGSIFTQIIKFNQKLSEVNINGRNTPSQVDFNIAIQNISKYKMPTYKVFLIGFIIFLLFITSVFLVSLVIGKFLFKSKLNIVNLFNGCVCSFIPMLLGIMLQVILSYISLTFALVPIVIGITISNVCLYHIVKEAMELHENRAVFVLPFTYIITAVIGYNYLQKIATNSFTMSQAKLLLMALFNSGLYY